MANLKNEGSKPASSRWEKNKNYTAPPQTTEGNERAFDARPKAATARTHQDYSKRYAAPETPQGFDAPEDN